MTSSRRYLADLRGCHCPVVYVSSQDAKRVSPLPMPPAVSKEAPVLGFPVPPPLTEDEAARVFAVRVLPALRLRRPRPRVRLVSPAGLGSLTHASTCAPQLREALKLGSMPADSSVARFCTDACLCRYLRARGWDVVKAKKMLDGTLAWRAASGVDALRFADVAAEAATGKMSRLGCRDRKGRPVLLMRPRFENTRQPAGQIQFLTWNMEAACRSMSKGQGGPPLGAGADLASEQMVIVVDFLDYSLRNAPPTKTSMETLHILLNHYPERLGGAVLLSPPALFQLLWAMVQPFLDHRTSSKIHFVDPATPAGKAKMQALLDLEQVDASLGGTGAEGRLPWDFKAYEARITAEEDAWRKAEAQAVERARAEQAAAAAAAAAGPADA